MKYALTTRKDDSVGRTLTDLG